MGRLGIKTGVMWFGDHWFPQDPHIPGPDLPRLGNWMKGKCAERTPGLDKTLFPVRFSPSTSWIHWNLGRSARYWDFAMMFRKAQDSRGTVVENSSIVLDWLAKPPAAMGPMFPRLCLSLIASVSAAIWHWAEEQLPGLRDWTDVEVSPDGSVISAVATDGALVSSFDGGENWYYGDSSANYKAETWICWGLAFYLPIDFITIIPSILDNLRHLQSWFLYIFLEGPRLDRQSLR